MFSSSSFADTKETSLVVVDVVDVVDVFGVAAVELASVLVHGATTAASRPPHGTLARLQKSNRRLVGPNVLARTAACPAWNEPIVPSTVHIDTKHKGTNERMNERSTQKKCDCYLSLADGSTLQSGS